MLSIIFLTTFGTDLFFFFFGGGGGILSLGVIIYAQISILKLT
jgi:hypothetical protein